MNEADINEATELLEEDFPLPGNSITVLVNGL